MTRDELKQKLEAVRDADIKTYAFRYCEGFDTLLPLLLDAYEALKKTKDVARSWHGEIAWDIYEQHSPEMRPYREALARIEAFATQGAHEQSEFENGEK